MRSTTLFGILLATGCVTYIDAPDKDPNTDDTDPVAVDDTDVSPVDDTDVDPPPPPPEVVQHQVEICPAALPATDGICDAEAGVGAGTVVRGTILGRSTSWVGGSVVFDEDGWITCVGCDCDADPLAVDATVITCPEAVVSPGLVNPHDHMTFSENRPLRASATRYEHRHDWRGSVSTPSNAHGTGRTSAGNQWVELRQLLAGTTTLVGSGSSDGLVRNADGEGDLLEGAPIGTVVNETFPLNDSDEHRETGCTWNYKHDEWDVSRYPAYVPHVAEGINDRAHLEFQCQSSSFDGAQDVTERNAAHIHSIGLTTEDYFTMARDQTVLVWSPRSNISLYGITADIPTFRRLGGHVALGTDWTYSGSGTPVRELACADQYNRRHLAGQLTDHELWLMVTAWGAEAIGADDTLGELAPGYLADLAVYDASNAGFHRAVIEARNTDVALVVRGGKALFGEGPTMSELGAACDAFTMCGKARQVCLRDEIGRSYQELVAAVPGSYPAFFCGLPDDEPTCVPSRPGQFTGTPTADDPDGDGVIGAADNCPEVFNPIRPLDGGAQPDADADGLGDPCDPTPLPDDLDGDGTPNALDTCPSEPNPDQADADQDGKGDVCDPCVDIANPDSVCPPAPPPLVTIVTVRTSLADGADVTVEGVVTGIGGSGFAIQDPAVADGRNAGIWVFTGYAPALAVGDEVQVQGTIDTYFDERQIAEQITTTLGSGAALSPIAVSLTDAASEAYEGVLVEISAGVVTDDAYDCAVDGACADPGLWEIGGPSGVVVYDRCYEDADWSDHVGEVPVVGVMGYRWSRRRIMPRTAGDFGP